MYRIPIRSVTAVLSALAALNLSSCNRTASQPQSSPVAETAPSGPEAPPDGGWWCAEHGIPEEQCALCDTQLAAKLHAAGDWCDKHERPDSLCFQCHPEKAVKFAQLYEAKYGRKPPPPSE